MKLKHMMSCILAVTLVLSFGGCGKNSEEDVTVTDNLGIDFAGTEHFESEDGIPELPVITTTEETTDAEQTTFSETTAPITMKTELITTTSKPVTSETTVTERVTETTTSVKPDETVTTSVAKPVVDVTAKTTVTSVNTEVVVEESSGKSLTLKPLSQTMNVMTNKGKQYWYSQLTDREANAYNSILSAVLKYSANVEFDTALTDEEYSRVFALVFVQNPEIFWMSGKTILSEDGRSANLFYLYDKKTSESMQVVLDKRVEELMGYLTPDMTDLEKVLFCHNYIVKYNSYSNESKHSSNAYGCLIAGQSQCAGYAKGLQYMCDQLEIPCIYVNGISSETGNTHAWNQVYMDGAWYNVDCMWDDPEMTPEDKKNVSYRYMGVPSDAIFGETHLMANMSQDSSFSYFSLPTCNSYASNADIRYGEYATTYEEIYEKLKQGCLTAVKEGRYCAHVKVESRDVYLDALERLFTNKEVYNIRKVINDTYGADYVVGFSAAPKNKLNYIEVTLKYGEGKAPN